MSIFYLPGPVLSFGHLAVNQSDKNSCKYEAYLLRKTNNKQISNPKVQKVMKKCYEKQSRAGRQRRLEMGYHLKQGGQR